jgi:predicted DNA-binding transcriptional regulator AlpA
MDTEDRLLDIQQLAFYLQIPVKTLYAWRYRQVGPPAIRVGRHLRYRWEDIAGWLADLADGPRERRS